MIVRTATCLAFAITALYGTGFVVYRTILGQGHNWQQGDWLITLASGPLRRGPGGEAVFWLADNLGVSPLAVVGILQLMALWSLLGAVFWGLRRLSFPPRLCLLALSPLCLAFWAADMNGALRKEVLGLMALLPWLLPNRPTWQAACLSVPLYAFAVAAHEVNVFLLPALIAALWLARRDTQFPWLLAGAYTGIAGAGALYAATYIATPDAAALCARVTQAGLDPNLCQGAMAWMDLSLAGHIDVSDRLSNGRSWTWLGFVATAGAVPAALAVWHAPHRRFALGIIALHALSFAPLYILALDWGRWMALWSWSLLLLILIGAVQRPGWHFWLRVPLSGWVFWPAVIIGIIAAPEHNTGMPHPLVLNAVQGQHN